MNDSHAAPDVSTELERLSMLPWFRSARPCLTDVFHERDFDLWPAGGVSHPDTMLGVADLGLAIVCPAMLN